MKSIFNNTTAAAVALSAVLTVSLTFGCAPDNSAPATAPGAPPPITSPQIAPPPAPSSTPSSSVSPSPEVIISPTPSPSPLPVRPATQSFTVGAPANDLPPLANAGKADKDGPALETGLVVFSGDRMTIKPLSISRQQKKEREPVVIKIPNYVCTQYTNVCTATAPKYERKCQNACSFCQKCQNEIFHIGCSMTLCCEQKCEDVQNGTQCVSTTRQCSDYDDHWTEYTYYLGLTSAMAVDDKEPMKTEANVAKFLSGIKLRFSFADEKGNQRQVDCPMGAFAPRVLPDQFTFLLREVAACPGVFADHFTSSRRVALINAIDEVTFYSHGVLARTWDYRVEQQPEQKEYHPEIDLSMSVLVQAGQQP